MTEPADPTPPRNIVPFNDHLSIAPVETEVGAGGARIPAVVELTNHFGSVHGGALFTVGEVAAARAILSLLGADVPNLRAITRRAEIRYLKMARGQVTATARACNDRAQIDADLDRDGRSAPQIDVTLTDAKGVVVAEMTVEWYVGRART